MTAHRSSITLLATGALTAGVLGGVLLAVLAPGGPTDPVPPGRRAVAAVKAAAPDALDRLAVPRGRTPGRSAATDDGSGGRVVLRGEAAVEGAPGCFARDDDGDRRDEWIGCPGVELFDLDRDGGFEWVLVATGADGAGRAAMHDTNRDGRLDHVLLDAGGDGRYEAEQFDGTGDLAADWYRVDLLDNDGIADTWVRPGSVGEVQANHQITIDHLSTTETQNLLCRANRTC